MNKIALIFFAVVSSLSMTLAIIASLIFTMDGIYLIWTFPLALLFAFACAFFCCHYMLVNKAMYRRMLNFFAKINPTAAIPGIEVFIPTTVFIGFSIFGFFFALLLFVGAVTQK